jgi:glycosyltransferase involved in cell wall biosynthesis
MKTVVFLSQFTLYNLDLRTYCPGSENFFKFGMGQFIAREFYKRNYPVKFESWRMDLRIANIMEKEIDGVKYRIFPSKRIRYFGEYSNTLLSAFKNESGNRDVVFHFMPNHPVNYHFFARFVKHNTIVATHLGGANPLWKYNFQGSWKSLILYWFEKYYLLLPYNHFISICKPEVQYFEKLKIPVSHMPIFGISREELFTIKSRNECRIKLGLPINKTILLQVGRANENRGFRWIMNIIDYYKNKEDYFLVFAGINKTDDYYNALVEKNVFMIPYLQHSELPDYYNAADMVYYFLKDQENIDFAGTSYVPLEALACGTPVVSNSFHHFPGNEVAEVSRIPKIWEEVIPMIENLVNANVSRERCREIVLKHFSWNNVVEKHWEIYNQ